MDTFVEHNVALTKRVENLRWTVKSKIENIRQANKRRIHEERVLLQTLARSSKKVPASNIDVENAIALLEKKIKNDNVTEECESRFRAFINEKEDLSKFVARNLSKSKDLLHSAEICSAKVENANKLVNKGESNLLLQFCPTFLELLRVTKLVHDFLQRIENSSFANSFKESKCERVALEEKIENVKRETGINEASLDSKVRKVEGKRRTISEMRSLSISLGEETLDSLKRNSLDLQGEIEKFKSEIIVCEKNTTALRNERAKLCSMKEEVENEIKAIYLNEELTADKLDPIKKEIDCKKVILTGTLNDVKHIKEEKESLLDSLKRIQLQQRSVEEEATNMRNEVEIMSATATQKLKNNNTAQKQLVDLQNKITKAHNSIEKMEKELHSCTAESDILIKEKDCIAKEIQYLSSLAAPQRNKPDQTNNTTAFIYENENLFPKSLSSLRSDLISKARGLQRSE